jgi:LmbE family N-acetylglucosaminyl deacetylase
MRGWNLENVRTVLVLGAHSDDIEIGAGGTIRWLFERFPEAKVRWVVFSAIGVREAEARHSAATIWNDSGRCRVDTHDFRDGFFPYEGGRVKEVFERLKSDAEPDLILTHHRDDLHQDHRVIAELTWNTFRNHVILEYEVPKYDGGLGSPNFFVPLSASVVDAKIEQLMRDFGTQRSKAWFTEETFRGLMRIRGVECRSPTGYAEGFYQRKAIWHDDAHAKIAAPSSRTR